jgi:hypothetical protein
MPIILLRFEAGANSLGDSISKNPSQERAGGVAQGVGPEFKPQCHKKKNSNNNTFALSDLSTAVELPSRCIFS